MTIKYPGSRLRDDEATVEIVTPPKPRAPRFKTDETMLIGDKKIRDLIAYQLLTFRLKAREEKFYLVIKSVEAGQVMVVFAYQHRALDPEFLQETTFVHAGTKYAYVPVFVTAFSRRFIQNSQYFQSSDPSVIVNPTEKFLSGAFDANESRTIPPPSKMPLATEYYSVEAIIAAHEKSWLEEDKKRLGRER